MPDRSPTGAGTHRPGEPKTALGVRLTGINRNRRPGNTERPAQNGPGHPHGDERPPSKEDRAPIIPIPPIPTIGRNPYSTPALTARSGHAPAIAPGLTMTSDGALTVDLYADADADLLPYDERYAEVGWVYRDEDTHRVMIALTGSGEHIPLTDSARDVVFAVASAIVGIVGGDTGVTRDRRCVMSGPDYGDEAIAVTHDSLPTTIAVLRDAQVMRMAAAVSSSLSACHPDAAAQMGIDAWPETTVYAPDDDATVLASVDLTEDRDGVILTDPAGLTYTLYPGDREALDWRDEEDVVRPVCEAVRAALSV